MRLLLGVCPALLREGRGRGQGCGGTAGGSWKRAAVGLCGAPRLGRRAARHAAASVSLARTTEKCASKAMNDRVKFSFVASLGFRQCARARDPRRAAPGGREAGMRGRGTRPTAGNLRCVRSASGAPRADDSDRPGADFVGFLSPVPAVPACPGSLRSGLRSLPVAPIPIRSAPPPERQTVCSPSPQRQVPAAYGGARPAGIRRVLALDRPLWANKRRASDGEQIELLHRREVIQVLMRCQFFGLHCTSSSVANAK